MNMCRSKPKVSWDDRNLSCPLLSGRSSHGLAMSHDMTAYAKLSCKALLKVDAGGDNNARLGQTASKHGWTCQCHNFWQPPPIEYPGVDLSAYASSALRSPQWLNQSREWHDMTWREDLLTEVQHSTLYRVLVLIHSSNVRGKIVSSWCRKLGPVTCLQDGHQVNTSC